MEVNKKQLADIFGASIRTIQNWQEQGMPVLRGGGSRTRALQPYSGMTGYNGIMRDALDARKSRLSGGRMTKETQSTTVSATASQADVTDVVPATEGENASAAQPDVNAQITAAVAAENSRIMGILNCEEAHGREEQARVLAETPGMTVETARRILAAAPQSAQARSDTALDRLMQGAPAPLAADNPASDAVNDLLNTPV